MSFGISQSIKSRAVQVCTPELLNQALDNANVARICAEIRDAWEQKMRGELSAEDFERCRRVLYASFVSQFDYPEDIADLAGDCEQNGFGVFDALDCIERASLQELQALLEELFLPEASVLSVLLPDSDKVKEENHDL